MKMKMRKATSESQCRMLGSQDNAGKKGHQEDSNPTSCPKQVSYEVRLVLETLKCSRISLAQPLLDYFNVRLHLLSSHHAPLRRVWLYLLRMLLFGAGAGAGIGSQQSCLFPNWTNSIASMSPKRASVPTSGYLCGPDAVPASFNQYFYFLSLRLVRMLAE